jgi:DNA polymerase-3 subunit epsilon
MLVAQMPSVAQARNNAIKISRDILAHPESYGILDTETTGLDGEVIEIAVIDSAGTVLVHDFRIPKGEIHPKALEVHGLSLEKLNAMDTEIWWATHRKLNQRFHHRTLLAYNVRFDIKVIENTSRIEDLDPLILERKPICIMQLWSDFLGVSRWEKLEGGDHTALGDCRATLERIKEMAAAELSYEDSDELVEVTAEFDPSADLEVVCKRRAEIAVALKNLKAEDESLKHYIAGCLEESGASELVLPDGTKATWGSNVVKLKALVHMDDLPASLVTTAVDKKRVEYAIQKGLPSDSPIFKMFSWESSKFLKFTKS